MWTAHMWMHNINYCARFQMSNNVDCIVFDRQTDRHRLMNLKFYLMNVPFGVFLIQVTTLKSS